MNNVIPYMQKKSVYAAYFYTTEESHSMPVLHFTETAFQNDGAPHLVLESKGREAPAPKKDNTDFISSCESNS